MTSLGLVVPLRKVTASNGARTKAGAQPFFLLSSHSVAAHQALPSSPATKL